MGLEHAGQREHVPHVVIDDQDLLVVEDLLRRVELLEQAPLLLRELPLDTVEEERRLVEQPLRRARVLHHDRVGELPELRCLLTRQLLAGVHDHRHGGGTLVLLQPLEQLEAAELRELQVDDHAVVALQL